ncbi:hypothetical protein TIFTF001_034222 [Ficus carica]|uniref:Uncharacterized protein n=1 Tax=Ficus carica TaxID=3494 RepID=A0AA88JAC7_FICCA|nr:hypothetical protein TIFTF001_034222 [Ficus carica]
MIRVMIMRFDDMKLTMLRSMAPTLKST